MHRLATSINNYEENHEVIDVIDLYKGMLLGGYIGPVRFCDNTSVLPSNDINTIHYILLTIFLFFIFPENDEYKLS